MPPAFNLSQDQTLQFKVFGSKRNRIALNEALIPQNKTKDFRGVDASSCIWQFAQLHKRPHKLPDSIFKDLAKHPAPFANRALQYNGSGISRPAIRSRERHIRVNEPAILTSLPAVSTFFSHSLFRMEFPTGCAALSCRRKAAGRPIIWRHAQQSIEFVHQLRGAGPLSCARSTCQRRDAARTGFIRAPTRRARSGVFRPELRVTHRNGVVIRGLPRARRRSAPRVA